jgi:hypothetical protein
MMRDMIGDRPEYPPRAGHTAVAHHDHLGVSLLGDPHQRFGGLAGPYVCLARHAKVCKSSLRPIDVGLGAGSIYILFVDIGRHN